MEQVIYNILSYLIIASALFVALKKVFEKIKPNKSSKGDCSSGCGGCSSKCDLKDLASNLNKD